MDVSLVKWGVLASLCLQNSIYTMGRKYIIKHEHVSMSEVLLVGELIKLVSCGVVSSRANPEESTAPGSGFNRLIWLTRNSGQMLIVSGVFAVMNILGFVALWYIGSAEYVIIAQLKILTTACASVVLLGSKISPAKWRNLFLLVIGCCIVSTANIKAANSSEGGVARMTGYALTIIGMVLSGWNSVYFEKAVKSTTERLTVWERNFQLAIYGNALYASIIAYNNISGEANQRHPVLANWTWFTWIVAFLSAAGGLLVAATLKYADAILKTLAAAGAILISEFFGHFLLKESWSLNIGFGSLVVIIAIANYTLDTTDAPVVISKSVEMLETGTPTLGDAGSRSPTAIGRGAYARIEMTDLREK